MSYLIQMYPLSGLYLLCKVYPMQMFIFMSVNDTKFTNKPQTCSLR